MDFLAVKLEKVLLSLLVAQTKAIKFVLSLFYCCLTTIPATSGKSSQKWLKKMHEATFS